MNRQTIAAVDLKTYEPTTPTDDVAADPILEILYSESWVVAPQEIWDSWTGLRRKNGSEFHGEVRPMGQPKQVWTGSRVCSCRTCQAHTEAKYRPN